MNSSLVKVIAWIYLILGVIGSVIMGVAASDMFYSIDTIGFVTAFIGIISTVGTAFVLFAIAKIMENTEYCTSKLSRLESQNKPAPISGASNSKMNLSAVASKPTGSEWRCPKCGKTNPTAVRVCKDCAYQK